MQFDLPSQLSNELEGRVAVAVELAVLGGRHTLKYFQTADYQVERKGDNSPVTIADRETEQLVRSEIQRRYPDDSILGEEAGEQLGSSEYQWIIDPIDGTKSFICGVPLYSTLLGITRHGQAIAGVIYIPALDEIIFASRGCGAWYRRRLNPDNITSFEDHPTWRRVQVSRRSVLADATLVVSQVDNFEKHGYGEAYRRLEKAVYITRSWGDGFGYLMVATGRSEIMADPILSPWDAAAVVPVIEEAGGRCTSFEGESTLYAGNLVGTNGVLHAEVLTYLKKNSAA